MRWSVCTDEEEIEGGGRCGRFFFFFSLLRLWTVRRLRGSNHFLSQELTLLPDSFHTMCHSLCQPSLSEMIEASIRCRLSEDIFFPSFPAEFGVTALQCRILEAVCVTLISEVNAEEMQHQVLCCYEQNPLGAAASAGGGGGDQECSPPSRRRAREPGRRKKKIPAWT